MDEMIMVLGPIVGGIFLYGIIQMIVREPGCTLNRNFASLGILEGKTLDEITAVCGSPNAVSTLPLYQWQATGYHVALLFDEKNICLGDRKSVV